MQLEHVLYTSDTAIASITLNRPERLNALTGQTMVEIGKALAHFQSDDDASVAIVTGAGRGFCSGGDRKETAERMAEGKHLSAGGAGPRAFHLAQQLFTTLDKPVIAAVNGPAMGGGMDLALWCDIRIASDRASFGELYIDRGLVPDMGGLYLLPRLIGYARATELLLTGDIIDAETALEFGLVNHVVPHDELHDAAREMAARIAAKPNRGVRATKRALARLMAPDWEREGDYHAALQTELLETQDFREADRAFVDRRPPDFRNR